LRAVAIYEKKLDADHPLCTRSLKNLARLYEDEERYARDVDRARYYALEGSRRINSYINTAFPGLSSGQQCAFVAVAKQQRDAILTTCQSRESIGAAYSLMMRWKGLLLESLRTKGAIKVAVQANPDLKQKQEQLESKIRLLAYFANQGGGTTSDAHLHRVYVNETAERERLEREISAAVVLF